MRVFADQCRLRVTSVLKSWSQVAPMALGLALTLLAAIGPAPAAAELSQAEIHQLQVQSYHRDYGVSVQAAERNLATQQRGVGIVRQLRVEQGNRYAGVWFDNGTGEFVVPTLPAANPAPVEASLSHAHLGGDFRIANARYTWAAASRPPTKGSMRRCDP